MEHRFRRGLIATTAVIATLSACSGGGGGSGSGANSGTSAGGSVGTTAGQTSTTVRSAGTGGTTSSVGGASTRGGSLLTAGAGGKLSQSGGSAGQSTILAGGAGGIAGANSSSSSNQAGGTANQTGISLCIAPACCVPITLKPTGVDVYQVGDTAIVNLGVEPSDPANISVVWMPFAEVTTSWGGTQICDTDRRRGKGAAFVTLRCPATVLSTPLPCGSSASVQVRLRSETYADTTPFGPVCVGTNDGTVATIPVPVKCPTCPSSSNFFGNQICDYPDLPSGNSTNQCRYLSLACPCTVNENTGVKVWMCPQP